MTYPKIRRRRNSLEIIPSRCGQSPRIRLTPKDPKGGHQKWLMGLQAMAEKNAKCADIPAREAGRTRMFWRTIATFAERLQSGVFIQVWKVRGDMSQSSSFIDEAFTSATKQLFKVS